MKTGSLPLFWGNIVYSWGNCQDKSQITLMLFHTFWRNNFLHNLSIWKKWFTWSCINHLTIYYILTPIPLGLEPNRFWGYSLEQIIYSYSDQILLHFHSWFLKTFKKCAELLNGQQTLNDGKISLGLRHSGPIILHFEIFNLEDDNGR